MSTRIVLISVVLALATLVSCSSAGKGGEFSRAQQLVDATAAQHPDVVRLTLHGVPAGESELRVVASTLESKRGGKSDPEDFQAFKGGQEVVLQEGANVDVTVALKDSSGKALAVAGVTLKGERDAAVQKARAIAAELAKAIYGAQPPLW